MTLSDLYAIICDRRDHPTSKSYTNRLMNEGEDEILKKVGEEAMEIILAAKSQGEQRLIEEISDIAYHLLVLLAYKNIPLEAIQKELDRRHQPRP